MTSQCVIGQPVLQEGVDGTRRCLTLTLNHTWQPVRTLCQPATQRNGHRSTRTIIGFTIAKNGCAISETLMKD